MNVLKAILLFTVVLLTASRAYAGDAGEADEAFVGPFPSWQDLRRDYGAVGDGRADDTAALQRALDDLTKHEKSCVLFIPRGTYRLTGSVGTVREAHTDGQGIAIVGEDPAGVILLWDGPEGDTMFRWDAWYAKISRLTFDGAGRAGTALIYGPSFSTYNETSDIIFRGAETGLAFGGPKTKGQAENEVLRCRFIRCETGIKTVNWNSMDIWVWYSRFEDCGRGVYNVMGNWHVWHCLFLRSRIADMSTKNLMVFSVVNNTSIGSHRFFDFSTGHKWGSPVSLTGNRVFDISGDRAVSLGNAGPYLLVDNVFRLSGETRAVRMTWGDQTLVGNTYTGPDAVETRGRFRRIAEKVVDTKSISDAIPTLPPTPPGRSFRVFEVPAGSNGDVIQEAIDAAARMAGQRSVVHLPMGSYKIKKTLVVPGRSDVQLVGDGAARTATQLKWSGPEGGVVLRLKGPSRATLRDIYIHAPRGRALVVEKADQPGGRIFADQLNTGGPKNQSHGRTTALRINGLDHTDVLMRALQGGGRGGAWIEVVGGPGAASAQNQISIFTGATASADGQYNVRQGGRLVVRGVYHERSSDSFNGVKLTDSGTLSIDATRFSYATSEKAPTILVDGFRGLFTLATSILLPVKTGKTCRIEIQGDGSGAGVLALNNQFWVKSPGTTADSVWQNRATPPVRGGLVGCSINGRQTVVAKSFEFLTDVGYTPDNTLSDSGPADDQVGVDDATILRHLAPLRKADTWLPAAVPDGVTDVRIHRLIASGGRDAVVEFRAD